ncbi:hypothetical protein GHT06_010153 [Daphnia sinensis]|uniref:Large ribosomal subunit protein mL50 n=1 Tax=Daphnia sinensis TaxID=1820382 RepID=A0AAD5KXQ3_9CRUS|nr:hypothetical protein GHT06_010153 [Daphnia sinensis]
MSSIDGFCYSNNSMATGLYQARRFASTIESVAKSLRDKSYLRPNKPYTPPADVEQKLNSIFESQLGSNSAQISNGRIKFKVLSACFKEFNHGIPNSRLHEITTTDDIKNFYLQEIDARVPLEKFKSIELPPNVSIQYDYHRFHPETDTMSGGVSAFPRRSTIVTGLSYKKKYAGYTSKPIWH